MTIKFPSKLYVKIEVDGETSYFVADVDPFSIAEQDSKIVTKRLILKPYYAGMVTDDHVRWLNDPEVVKYSEQRHKTHTLESVHSYVNDIACNPHSFIWDITATYFISDNPEACNAIKPTLIGTITAHIDQPNSVANVGIMIGERDFWGWGFGSEAWNAVCNWLFETKNIRKIEMGCHYENRAMRNLAETCGMKMEGVRHDHFVVNGEPQHLLLYAKMRPVKARVCIDESVASKPIRNVSR